MAGATLTRMDLSETAIFELSALSDCLCLEEVVCCFCRNLDACTGLEPLARLWWFKGSFSAIANIDALGACAALEIVELNECAQFIDASPLARCPALRVLDVTSTPCGPLTCLTACRGLEQLIINDCGRVRAGLPYAPSLFMLETRATNTAELLGLADLTFDPPSAEHLTFQQELEQRLRRREGHLHQQEQRQEGGGGGGAHCRYCW